VGVPAVNRRAQCPREGDGTCGALTERVEATGLATAGNRRPGSCVPVRLRAGSTGQRAGASGESDRESPVDSALAAVGCEPTRKQEARESGYGSSGRESSGGKFQGRERHERRPRSVVATANGGV